MGVMDLGDGRKMGCHRRCLPSLSLSLRPMWALADLAELAGLASLAGLAGLADVATLADLADLAALTAPAGLAEPPALPDLRSLSGLRGGGYGGGGGGSPRAGGRGGETSTRSELDPWAAGLAEQQGKERSSSVLSVWHCLALCCVPLSCV
eukprot:gene12418-biopygen6464